MTVTTVVASSTRHIPDGYGDGSNDILHLALNTGDTVACHINSITRESGISRTTFDFLIEDFPSGSPYVNRDTAYTETNVGISYTATHPVVVALVLQGGGGPSPAFRGDAFGYSATLTTAAVPYCPYGTELIPGASFVYYLTPGLIDTWLAAVGLPWLAPIFTALWFSSINVTDLCSVGPPPFPVINLETVGASAATVLQILKCIAWPNVCRCKTGSPSPTPYPVPAPTEPTGWPSAPTFPCDPMDLCTTLALLQSQVAAVQAQLQQVNQLVTLQQRYSVPFSYLDGVVRAGLTGTGAVGIARCVGVLVDVTAQPAGLRQVLGQPNYTYDLGWISVATSDGMLDEIRLTRPSTTWLSKLIPSATSVGYALRDGVTITITELLAEP